MSPCPLRVLQYETQLFSGLKYAMPEPRVTVIVFRNGKLNIMGGWRQLQVMANVMLYCVSRLKWLMPGLPLPADQGTRQGLLL